MHIYCDSKVSDFLGSISDRGYFSKENIHYMDKCGYDFVIMMKGMKSLASELILENKGSFVNSVFVVISA